MPKDADFNAKGEDGRRAVKGGAWSTPRTDCRTECRTFARKESTGHIDVGFRIVKVTK